MSYQEIYKGLNKRASNEQIKKLDSMIGMKKKAAENIVEPHALLYQQLRKLPKLNQAQRSLGPDKLRDWERHTQYYNALFNYGSRLRDSRSRMSSADYLKELAKDIPSYTESEEAKAKPPVFEEWGYKRAIQSKR